jgi:hypothetical protein
MKRILIALSVVLFSVQARAQCVPGAMTGITASDTGITAKALSGSPTTLAIPMGPCPAHQLSLTLSVTPGSTTAITLTCYQSQDGSTWGTINPCDNSTPTAVCVPDVRGYTLANYTGTVRVIKSNWVITEKFAQCVVSGSGSGTVTITGVRS